MLRRTFLAAALVAATVLITGSSAPAAFLVQYEMAGQPGDQAFTAPSFSATGLSGVNLTRGPGLVPNAGANSINSAGWNDLNPDDFYSFGFNLQGGVTATIDQLQLAARSSATGPGFVNVLYSANGGPETLITTLTMPGTDFVNTILNLGTPVTATSSFRVVLRAANNTSAVGGTIGSAGTFRIGDYSPDGGATFAPIALSGTISGTVVPEPSAMTLLALGGVALPVILLRRRVD